MQDSHVAFPMRPKRTAAQLGTASITNLYQSTIGFAPDGTLKATLSPSAFQPSEAAASSLDDFAFGSILRIRLKNFQKYSECTIRPGPHMNMVLGPNGTGKSTLVAAIAFGLGFPTSVLGRSNDIKEFIKHGQEKAFIELVMRTGPDPQQREDALDAQDSEFVSLAQSVYSRPFVTIRRVINNVSGKAQNEWYLNDSSVSHRLIQQLARILRAQVDNMCQFLPQDKVGDFVKMNPMQMLEATQEAAAAPGTLEKHKRLIQLRERDREIEASLERDRRQMREDESQVAALQERKRAAQEARDRVERLRNLRQKRPWLKYKQLREEFIRKKEQRNEARKRLEQETLELNAALHEQLTTVEAEQKAIQKQMRSIDRQKSGLRSAIELEMHEQGQRSARSDTLKSELLNKRAARVRNRQQAEKYREELRQMDEMIREKQAELDSLSQAETESNEAQLKTISLQLREAQFERDKIAAARDALKEEGTRHQEVIHEATRQLQKLDDRQQQKLDRLRTINVDAYKALHWLDSEGNRSKFRGQVLGPLCMEIGVKNEKCPEMSRMVESCVSRQILASFVVTDRSDHELFMRECSDERRLRINCILMPNLASLKHSCPWKLSDLQSVGFDGVLMDALEGSELVLQALCEVAFIHKIPYCLGSADERLDMRACESNGNLVKFVARDAFFELRRSRYAPGEVANRCSQLKNELYLSSSGGARNESVRQELLAQIESARAQQSRLEREMHQKLAKAGNLDAEIDALRKQQSALTEAKRARNSLLALLNAKRDAREAQKRRLRELVKKAAEFDESAEQAGLRELITAQATSFAKLQGMQAEMNSCLMDAVELAVEEQCLSLQANHLRQIIERNSMANEALKIALQQAEAEMAAAKAAAEEALADHQSNSAADFDEQTFSELPDDLNVLDGEIAEIEAYLQARGYRENQFTDVAEREYASRMASLTSVAQAVSLAESEQAELRGQIRTLAQEWRSAVDDVIIRVNERFRQLFESINCRGAVELGVPANELDFDRYELAIKVAFRSHEIPQLLGTRQSGGERSVSTMLYLLSFQNLARASLRVVDEINQGMDEEYERRVYSLIVETATRATNTQYFLISPKLLKGLQYSDRMRILFVYNGPGVPSILGN